MTSEDRIYVGYLPLPKEHRKALFLFAGTIMWVILFASFAIAFSQRDPGPAVWQTNLESFEGTLFENPYPMLVTDEGETLMLVRMGKVGAQGDGVDGLDARRVRVHGRMLRRDGRRIVELADVGEVESDVVENLATGANAPRQQPISHETLSGEIVDYKCFLGAMKPGDGKAHQACAILCISGGIPPMLVTRNDDGSNRYQLVLAANGEPAEDDLVGVIGIPVEVQGNVERWGDLEVIKMTQPVVALNP